jgi:enoyl-CoA hydratase/carnithine racemase
LVDSVRVERVLSPETKVPMAEDPQDTIHVDVCDGVATITLNRPDRLNALTTPMRLLYIASLRQLDADPDVRAIVVTGAGRGFCSGADIAVLGGDRDELSARAARPDTAPTIAMELSKPLVAAVNGAVAGVGFAIMLAADVRFVAASAKISTSFARFGLVAEYGAAWLLPRIIGMGRATDILLSGRTFDGTYAAEIGLATEALEVEQVLPRSQAWARDAAQWCAPWSMTQIKHQLYQDSTMTAEQAVARSVELMLESFTRPDLTEALEARAAKRPPRFATE